MTNPAVHPSSYRDPSGFVFQHDNIYYRQVNKGYAADYRLLMDSGLYNKLIREQLLIPHTEWDDNITGDTNRYKTLLPQQLPFTSYPYEWSFTMLKDAALLTLRINKIAMDHGMILKDATAFNVQFPAGKPVFIDTLSFEKYDDARPWIAYRQFCESFLFPLYLAHYRDADMIRMLSVYPDGIPLQLTARLLPFSSRFTLGVWLHVFLQQRISRTTADNASQKNGFSKQKLLLLLDGLTGSCKRLKRMPGSDWSDYYQTTILSQQYLREKEEIFSAYLDQISFASVIDLGANEGYFSKIAARKANWVVSTDLDGNCIESLYQLNKTDGTRNILPLVVDLGNPSPAIGFHNRERPSFQDRARADLVLALALVHHLCLSKNIPLAFLARWMAEMCNTLIIEFIPREDPKALELVRDKNISHDQYSEASFEEHFGTHFHVAGKHAVPGTSRTMYLMSRKS